VCYLPLLRVFFQKGEREARGLQKEKKATGNKRGFFLNRRNAKLRKKTDRLFFGFAPLDASESA
jgi:hypothetical protein